MSLEKINDQLSRVTAIAYDEAGLRSALAASDRQALQAVIVDHERFREGLRDLLGFVLSVRGDNTWEWMDELHTEISQALKVLRDNDRFALVEHAGEMYFKKAKP